MRFDFCFAAFNSEKWLKGCVEAISKLSYDKKQISLYFADNASTDNTVGVLNDLILQYEGVFAEFKVINMPQNNGFGTASNAAARAGTGDYVFFFNIDTEICEEALAQLEMAITQSDTSFAAFELRQLPYEHPKYYNPITMETSWASGAAFVLRREVFEQTGGFDETIFMYAEDVELSWRLRLMGYKIKYVPKALTYHYAYTKAGEVKPSQLAGSTAANLLVRYKFGTGADIRKWFEIYNKNKDFFDKISGTNKLMVKQIKIINKNKAAYRRFYNKYVKGSQFEPQFMDFDYEFARGGAFYVNKMPTLTPKFSVLVRTYKRPEVLRLTLKSLHNQTYKNFEVIVVEDGENPVSQQVVKDESAGLDIKYYPVTKQIGRCKAGNFAIEKASGDFLVFLDDDDYFFAEALEVFAALHEEKQDCALLAAGAIEGACKPLNSDATEFLYTQKSLRGKDNISIFNFSFENPLPIQAIAFRKDLPVKYGGFDEELDALEDWDIWLKYLSNEKIVSTEKGTSIYKVPSNVKASIERDEFITKYRAIVFEKMANYNVNVSAKEIYGLFWQPQNCDNLKALRETAKEIKACRTWKVTALARWPVFAICYPVVWVTLGLGYLFEAIAKVFFEIRRRFQSAADYVGPVILNPDKANVENTRSFVILAKKSFSLNVIGWIKKGEEESE